MKRLLILLFCLATAPMVVAETRYITDQFEIPLRAGESLKYKVRRNLTTGTPVEVLSHNAKSGYSRVRTEDGLVGFVPSDRLLEEPIARDQVAGLEAKIAELQARLEPPPSMKDLQAQLDQALADKRSLEEELLAIRQTAGEAPRIARERAELRQSVANLTRQVAELEQTNRDLGYQAAQRWFLIGGGAVIGGVFLGFLLPNLRLGRRRKFDSRL